MSRQPRLPLVSEILDEVADYYGLRVADLIGYQKGLCKITARQVAQYLAHELTQQSASSIGRAMRRDHATILHAVRRVQSRLLVDAELRDDVAKLTRRINDWL